MTATEKKSQYEVAREMWKASEPQPSQFPDADDWEDLSPGDQALWIERFLEQPLELKKVEVYASGYHDVGLTPEERGFRKNPSKKIKDGMIADFDEKITVIEDLDTGEEYVFDIDDIEAVSKTPIDDLMVGSSCKCTFTPMVDHEGDFHGNYLQQFEWWEE